MAIRLLCALGAALVVAGCASTAPESTSSSSLSASATPWLDAQFQHDPALVTVKAPDLFRLDAGLRKKLDEAEVREVFKDVR